MSHQSKVYMLWFDFLFWFNFFLNQFKIFQTGLKFFKPDINFQTSFFFFSSTIYKKWKISLYIPLSYSLLFSLSSSWFILSPNYSTPTPEIPIKREY